MHIFCNSVFYSQEPRAVILSKAGEQSPREGVWPDADQQLCYLVVDNDMHGAVSRVGWQVTQVEGLVHDALASKRRVPMQEDGHDLQTHKEVPNLTRPRPPPPHSTLESKSQI